MVRLQSRQKPEWLDETLVHLARDGKADGNHAVLEGKGHRLVCCFYAVNQHKAVAARLKRVEVKPLVFTVEALSSTASKNLNK